MELVTIASMLGKLLSTLIKPGLKEFGKIWFADQELEKLIAANVRVKAILDNCEKNKATHINDPDLEMLLQELEWYWYDIEDFVDDLGQPKSKKRITTPRKIVDLRVKLEQMCVTIESVMVASRENKSIQIRDEQVSVVSWLFDKTPFISGTRRDEDKKLIIMNLKSTSLNGVSIVGMDGLGKTALARQVAVDNSITSEFPIILYAHVSGHFQSQDVVKKLVSSSNQGVDDLLQGQKALIMLDDLWSVSTGEWENFEHNFLKRTLCWKILATTRNPKVAVIMRTSSYNLETMSDADCEHLIMEISELAMSDDREVWATDVKEIAKMCKGFPIIAKKFGLTLSAESNCGDGLADALRHFKNCIDLMQLSEFKQALPLMMLNKPQLELHLKRCFAYCSLFPPGHTFQKDQLIQFWEVEGLVHPQISSVSQCFDDLLSRSIFQPPPPSQSTDEKQLAYEIHYFNRQFVETFASEVVLRIDEGTKDTPSTFKSIRHLSITCQNVNIPTLLGQIKECLTLRTFILLHPNEPKTLNIPYSSFQKLERLRLLDLSHTNISKLQGFPPPKPLKHLTYLDLSNSDIKALPKRICPVFPSLKVLKICGCPNLQKLPTDLNMLISLKHLHINTPVLPILPSELGKLTNLEYLNSYVVGEKEGYKVGELRNMKHLTEICISRVEKISTGEEAQESMLGSKKRLTKLTLEWDEFASQEVNAAATDVLEGLEPENDMKDLTVRNFPGQNFPLWLTSSSRKLVSIYLENCVGCTTLPPFGQLPTLRTLVLVSFENLEVVDRKIIGHGVSVFRRLESIKLIDMPLLHRWDVEEGDMPRLLHVTMIDCPMYLETRFLNHFVRRV